MDKKLISLIIFGLFSVTVVFSQTKYAVQNVSVIPMNTETVLLNQTVLISNGKIEAVAASSKIKIPGDYNIVDGTGKYLMPGLMDMHTHFYNEQGNNVNTCETELKMMLANGLTTVRIMAGHPNYLEARENVKTGKWQGPDLIVASPQLVGRWVWDTAFKNYAVVDTKEKAIQAVKKFKLEGYDVIKLTFMISSDVYDAITATAKEENIKVVGHVGPKVKLSAALAAKEQIEHMDEFIDILLPDTTYNHGQSVSDMNVWRKNAWATVPYLDESKIPALAKRVKDAGIYVTPTNYFFISFFGEGRTEEQIKQAPEYNFLPSVIKEECWKNRETYIKLGFPEESRKKYVSIRKQMVYALWKAGVPLMAGSDSPEFFLVAGFSLHDELKTFVDAGLTPFAALQTATGNPSAFFGFKNKGTVEKGKDADLLLLDKNPLENITNTRTITAVFKHGLLYNKSALDKMLLEAKNLGR